MNEVRVIGAGLSGLATAWYVSGAGGRATRPHVQVVEAGPGPGGLIQTSREPEGLVETAARAFTHSERVLALFGEAGVEARFPVSQSKRRFIHRGRPRRWPLTPIETAGLAARAGKAWLTRGLEARGEESVADWGRRVLGGPATEWLIAPVLQGIYATPPGELSAKAIFGSRARGRGKLFAPPGGMGELMARLHDRLVERGVTFEFNAPASAIDPDQATVICTNAPAAARLLAPLAPEVAAAIGRIRMLSLVTATAFYARHPNDVHGFGILFPRAAGIRALGVLFNADIFAGRSSMRSETWIYGDLSSAALPDSEPRTAAAVAADRQRLTGRSDPPVAIYVTPQFDALPVYDRAVLDAVAAARTLPPTIGLAGNYLGRLGVSRLVEGAAAAAERVGETWDRQDVDGASARRTDPQG